MPFPFSATIRIEIPSHEAGDVKATLSAMHYALLAEKARHIIVVDNHISFQGGFFRFVDGRNQLAAITSGRIQVESHAYHLTLTAQISFLQMFLFTTLILGVMFFMFRELLSPLLMWAWIFGGNYARTRYRFPRFLRTAATKNYTGPSAALQTPTSP